MRIYERDGKIVVEMKNKTKEYKATKSNRELFEKFKKIVLYWEDCNKYASFNSDPIYSSGFNKIPWYFSKETFKSDVKEIYDRLYKRGFEDNDIVPMQERLKGRMKKLYDREGFLTLEEIKENSDPGDVVITSDKDIAVIKTMEGPVVLKIGITPGHKVLESPYKSRGTVFADYVGLNGIFGKILIKTKDYNVLSPYFVSNDLEIITAYLDGEMWYKIVNGKKVKMLLPRDILPRDDEPRIGDYDNMDVILDYFGGTIEWKIGDVSIYRAGNTYHTFGPNFRKISDEFPYEVIELGVI